MANDPHGGRDPRLYATVLEGASSFNLYFATSLEKAQSILHELYCFT